MASTNDNGVIIKPSDKSTSTLIPNVSYKAALVESTVDNVVPLNQSIVTKPPIVPIKRKKAVGRSTESLVDPNDIKRQKFETKLVVVNKENKPNMVVSKPPLPPKPKCLNTTFDVNGTQKLKKRNEESNAIQLQSLRAQNEQLRLEVNDLKIALNVEKNAVRSLRAQSESETRKARLTKRKQEEATVQLHQRKNNMVTTKPPKVPKKSQESTNSLTADIMKLTNEIVRLKELNKTVEEKLQISLESERRHANDIRVQKDAYELRLTQLTKSAKTQVHRMVDSLKTKDKQIEKLKKEIDTLKNINNKDLIMKLTHSEHEVRKLNPNKRIERNNQSTQTLTEVDNVNKSSTMPTSNINIMIAAHGQEQIIDTDNDSALSSGPTSISPLPSNELNNGTVNMLWKMDPKDSQDDEYKRLEEEKQFIEDELEMAKEQIESLEKYVKTIEEQSEVKKLKDKIARLQCKEEELLKETQELQEQNELLEFRIIELEESNDKCSTRNSSSPDTRDMWTDTEDNAISKVHTTVERTDSGITSPSHHSVQSMEIDTTDMPINDKLPSDDLRQRLSNILKRYVYDEDDKICLFQILSLLNNIEALTQDQAINNDGMVIDEDVKPSFDCKLAISARPLSTPTKGQSKIIATVQPYNNTNFNQLEEPTAGSTPKKLRSCSSLSLQESGIFDTEAEGFEYQLVNQTTQTDPTDFPVKDKPSGDLCAEIQKLNKFREKIEECATKSSNSSHIVHKSVVNLLPSNNTNENHLRFYQRRIEFLENKIAIYESSGDTQIRRLAKRLQRELELESKAKYLDIQVQKLKTENLRLEDERCELEEIENDTRLRLQKLEVELEILSQRSIELEMSRDNAKAHANCLQDTVSKAQERINCLEEHEKEMKRKMEMITTFMPAILLFNSWKVTEAKKPEPDCSRYAANKQPICSCLQRSTTGDCNGNQGSPVLDRLHELMNREKELTQNITELNRAYNETLESADNLWAQMEKEYKQKLTKSEENVCILKCKINQLEERLKNDSCFAQERICQLEESENTLKHRICKMNRDQKDLNCKHQSLQEEYNNLKEEHIKMKSYIDGPAADNLERERKKTKEMAEEVQLANKMLNDIEEVHKNELNLIKSQLTKAHKELIHIEVTNGELREEVTTLECGLKECRKQREADEEMMKNLMEELKCKTQLLERMQPPPCGQSLAQELCPRVDITNVCNLNQAAEKLAEALHNYQTCKGCAGANDEVRDVAKEVKDLADVVLGRKTAEVMKARQMTTYV